MTDDQIPTENQKSESAGDAEFMKSLGVQRTGSSYKVSDSDNPDNFASCEINYTTNLVTVRWQRDGLIAAINVTTSSLPVLCTIFEGIIEEEFPPTVSFYTDDGTQLQVQLQPGMPESFKHVLDGMDLWSPSALWFHDEDNNRVTLTPVIEETPNA